MMPVIVPMSRLAAFLSLCSLLVAGFGLVLMTVLVGWGVFGRYVLNDTPTWVEAVSLFLMSWFIILGAAVGVRERDHLGFEVGLHYAPPPLRSVLVMLNEVLVLIFGVAMVVFGFQLAAGTWGDRMPLIYISKGWDYVPICVGGALIAFFSLERILLILTDTKPCPLAAFADHSLGSAE